MNLIKESIVFLQALTILPMKQVRMLLKHVNKQQVLAIGEIAKNILAKVINIPSEYKDSLKRYKGVIRKLANPESTSTSRYNTIVSKPEVIARMVQAVVKKLLKLV